MKPKQATQQKRSDNYVWGLANTLEQTFSSMGMSWRDAIISHKRGLTKYSVPS